MLIVYMEIGRRIFMASQQFHNQPWKAQVKILEEGKEDFEKVLSSNELQLLQVPWDKDDYQAMIPFSINGKMMYTDLQVNRSFNHIVTAKFDRPLTIENPSKSHGQQIMNSPRGVIRPWCGTSARGLTLQLAPSSISLMIRFLTQQSNQNPPLEKGHTRL